MKVLFVASHNQGQFAAFVREQAQALTSLGVEVELFGIEGHGIKGYLQNLGALKQKIRSFQPHVIHAHFGLSGVLANLQSDVPVVTTYHGCDINTLKLRMISLPALLHSRYNIFVSVNQLQKLPNWLRRRHEVLPCGVDCDAIRQIAKADARRELGLQQDKKYILFSSSFSRSEKNYPLAEQAMSQIPDAQLLEFKGYDRAQVYVLMHAVDCGLLTSIREGSPMFTKELLACGTPVVSTNVGDVSEQFKDVDGAYITTFDSNDVAAKVQEALDRNNRVTLPPDWMQRYDNRAIAKRLIEIYNSL